MRADKRHAEKRHNREGLALIEMAAITRYLHADVSTTLVKRLNALVHRALEEYSQRRGIKPGDIDADIEATVHKIYDTEEDR